MKNEDYGFYGKGTDGYVHYQQGVKEAEASRKNSRKPAQTSHKQSQAKSNGEAGVTIVLLLVSILLLAAAQQQTGEGLTTALTVLGIIAFVGLIIYGYRKSK